MRASLELQITAHRPLVAPVRDLASSKTLAIYLLGILISIILIIPNKIKEYYGEPSALFGLLNVVRESTYYMSRGNHLLAS